MENWPDGFFQAMRSPVGKILPTVFYVSWIFIGNYILLNLFLSILLDSFLEENEEEEEALKVEELRK